MIKIFSFGWTDKIRLCNGTDKSSIAYLDKSMKFRLDPCIMYSDGETDKFIL